ncbi:MAG: molybdopterin molybdotransferase MoeA [Elusimicrobia bacterium]|nr:molybdopterin molybdotransferase MoeA [Elusimicrobiota bacterium]
MADMIPLEQALAIVDRELGGAALPRETLPVAEALGRWLAANQTSRFDLPPFDKSAMDGYAVAGGEGRDAYRVARTVAAGSMPGGAVAPDEAVKVMTGAPVPEGTGRVIRVEDVRPEGSSIRVMRRAPEANICRRGEDLRRGDVVLAAGTRLDPVDLASLIACGVTRVEAVRRVRLAIISTGDELVDDPAAAQAGKIMNANGPLLRLLAARHWLDVVREETVRDDPEATLGALRSALERADLVLVSGGVSAGDFDFVSDALTRAGLSVGFSRLAVKPGLPTTFASRAHQAAFGLPGNPVAVYVMFHLLVLRAAARLSGGSPPVREFPMSLARGFARRRTERAELVPCRISAEGSLEAVEFHGSAHLAALSAADGLFVVPAGTAEVAAGRRVGFLPLRAAVG